MAELSGTLNRAKKIGKARWNTTELSEMQWSVVERNTQMELDGAWLSLAKLASALLSSAKLVGGGRHQRRTVLSSDEVGGGRRSSAYRSLVEISADLLSSVKLNGDGRISAELGGILYSPAALGRAQWN